MKYNVMYDGEIIGDVRADNQPAALVLAQDIYVCGQTEVTVELP